MRSMTMRQFTLLVGLCCVLALPAEAARFFKYVDERGIVVMSHTIPNDRVKYGYEIVDQHSRVIQRVAPQLSEVEYQQKLALEAAQSECRSALNRVKSLYRSIGDIDYAEKQSLESIDTQIANTKANLSHMKNQRQDLEEQAAQLDIAGKTISNVLLDNIESAKSQEKNLTEQIEARYAEKLAERQSYAFDREVFRLPNCDNGLPGDERTSLASTR